MATLFYYRLMIFQVSTIVSSRIKVLFIYLFAGSDLFYYVTMFYYPNDLSNYLAHKIFNSEYFLRKVLKGNAAIC